MYKFISNIFNNLKYVFSDLGLAQNYDKLLIIMNIIYFI